MLYSVGVLLTWPNLCKFDLGGRSHFTSSSSVLLNSCLLTTPALHSLEPYKIYSEIMVIAINQIIFIVFKFYQTIESIHTCQFKLQIYKHLIILFYFIYLVFFPLMMIIYTHVYIIIISFFIGFLGIHSLL